MDWTDPSVWSEHKTVDLACGSGTLLAAMLTDMKRRAREQGASEGQITELQKLAVEETIKGLEINPVSLQLAASQLTAGNQDIRYRRMGLHLMPYGPSPNDPMRVSVGTLELLGQKAIVAREGELNLPDNQINSQIVWNQPDDAELEDAVDAAKDARIVIMNPPFSSRSKMGEKFPKEIQQALRSRADDMENLLVRSDGKMNDFTDKNSIGPLFVALADRCLQKQASILAMINPTIALCTPSGLNERRILAERYHIHTVLTGRWPREFTLSQNVEIDECIVIAVRHSGSRPATRFVHLDRMPHDGQEVAALHRALQDAKPGLLADGWGEVSAWPAERIEEGDWTPAIWRSPELAEAARLYATHPDLISISTADRSAQATGRQLRGSFEPATAGTPGSFAILKSKGADAQTRIQSQPDEWWVPKNRDEDRRKLNGGVYPETERIMQKAGHLLMTAGQDSKTGRLTATADNTSYVGNGWIPVTGMSPTEAKATAVFVNSTAGRLQLMRNPGKKIPFPTYSVREADRIRIPNIKDDRIRDILADCWERTQDTEVPPFRDGECEVRRLWDEAVAEAMGWNADELARLRHLLHQEPHVRGLGYNQYADELDENYTSPPMDRETFESLADEWERDRPRGVDIVQMTRHTAYQQIIAMGEPAVPWLLNRLATKSDHWFVALSTITGAKPVPPESRGRVKEMVQAWLDWGRKNGYELTSSDVD